MESSQPYSNVLESRTMPGAKWFTGAALNYAQHIFRGRDAKTAISDQDRAGGGRRSVSWGELERRTSAFASSLREHGRRQRRPGRGLSPERTGGSDGSPRLRQRRGGLVELRAGLWGPERRRPVQADRAQGADRRLRIQLQGEVELKGRDSGADQGSDTEHREDGHGRTGALARRRG